MLYSFVKPLLFALDPESAHNLTLNLAKLSPTLGKLSGTLPDAKLVTKVGSVNWTGPVGLAAGLDKNAEALDFFSAQGFGAIECGTVTLKAQAGNPRPRMFRYPDEQSLRNAMGFPNQGLEDILPRLKRFDGATPIGVNIGKNKDTEAADSIGELTTLFRSLLPFGKYFVINVSSPNTPGLRALQEKSYLTELFSELNRYRGQKDLYLKIAPDLPLEKVSELTKLCEDLKLTGIIATNTTIMPDRGVGGISGVLLREKAKSIREIILKEKNSIELIAVGGMTNVHDVFDLWSAGGKALQVYTAYVYQGPQLLKTMNKSILHVLEQTAVKDLNSFFKLSLSEKTKLVAEFKRIVV